MSTVRCQPGWRGAGTYALSRKLGAKNVLAGCRGMQLLSQSGIDGAASSGTARLSPAVSPSGLAVTPRAVLGQMQTRSFRKANYAERVPDSEKAEEILETLEVRDDEKDTQRPRRALNESEGSPSGQQNAERHEDMTKGENVP